MEKWKIEKYYKERDFVDVYGKFKLSNFRMDVLEIKNIETRKHYIYHLETSNE